MDSLKECRECKTFKTVNVTIVCGQPEGVPRVQATPVILEVNSGQPFLHVQPIAFPSNAVAGSQRITVAVAGAFFQLS